MGNIIAESYKLMAEIKPDAVLVLGDTNSCLSVIGAKRLHIPIFHMEAGNRCKDECLPEETNRRIVDIISDVKFQTFGCGSAIASSSMATELIKGKPLSQALELTNKAVAEALDGLPAHKLHCSVLAEEAIKAAIEDYQKKKEAGEVK